jgi:hypothetical protein
VGHTVTGAEYEFVIRGRLGDRLAQAFSGFQVAGNGGSTVVRGWMPDQSALHGVLARIRDLGLELQSVRRLD